MDPNCGATAPHEPNRGAWRPGLGLPASIPFYGRQNDTYRTTERGGGMHGSWMATAQHQPTEQWCWQWGGGVGEEMRMGGTCVGGNLLVILGKELRDIGGLQIEVAFHDQAGDLDGSAWSHTSPTPQSTSYCIGTCGIDQGIASQPRFQLEDIGFFWRFGGVG